MRCVLRSLRRRRTHHPHPQGRMRRHRRASPFGPTRPARIVQSRCSSRAETEALFARAHSPDPKRIVNSERGSSRRAQRRETRAASATADWAASPPVAVSRCRAPLTPQSASRLNEPGLPLPRFSTRWSIGATLVGLFAQPFFRAPAVNAVCTLHTRRAAPVLLEGSGSTSGAVLRDRRETMVATSRY